MAQEDHLAQLITDMKDSLEREIHAVQQAIAQLSEKLDRQDTRLSRQGGIIQGGARQITRMVDWTEAADDQATKRDVRIAELERRIADVEKRLEGK